MDSGRREAGGQGRGGVGPTGGPSGAGSGNGAPNLEQGQLGPQLAPTTVPVTPTATPDQHPRFTICMPGDATHRDLALQESISFGCPRDLGRLHKDIKLIGRLTLLCDHFIVMDNQQTILHQLGSHSAVANLMPRRWAPADQRDNLDRQLTALRRQAECGW